MPIPSVGEPFQDILIDVVGPLPKTKSGYEYMLTIMDRVSRYPEAIPLKSIKSPKIVEALLDFFLVLVSLEQFSRIVVLTL